MSTSLTRLRMLLIQAAPTALVGLECNSVIHEAGVAQVSKVDKSCVMLASYLNTYARKAGFAILALGTKSNEQFVGWGEQREPQRCKLSPRALAVGVRLPPTFQTAKPDRPVGKLN